MTLAFSPLPNPHSPLRAFDPRWKLVSFTLLLIVTALLRTYWPTLTAFVLGISLFLYGRIPARWVLIRLFALLLLLSPFLITLPFVMADAESPNASWYVPSQAGVHLASLLATKAMSLVMFMLILLASTRMDHLLKAAQSLRIPGILIQLFALTYRYVFLMIEEFTRLRIALRIRGFQNRANLHSYRTVGRLMGIVLVRSYEQGERVSQAMRCRGFDGQFRALTDFRTTWRDVFGFLLLSALACGLFVWDWQLQK